MSRSSRPRNKPAEDHPAALPDLSPGMSLSAIRQLPVAALRRYADLYSLPCKGTKQAVSKNIYEYLREPKSSHEGSSKDSATESEGSSGSTEGERSPSTTNTVSHRHRLSTGDTDCEESTDSPEGEQTPSRTTSHSRHHRRTSHRRCHRSTHNSDSGKSGSSLEGERTPSAQSHSRRRRIKRSHHQYNRHCRRSKKSHSRHQSSSSSTTSESSSDDDSDSTSSPEPKRRRPSNSSSSLRSHGKRKHTSNLQRRKRHSQHGHSRFRPSRRHHPHSSIPIPRKTQSAIERGEFVDLSMLLSEHLTMAGHSNKIKKSARTRLITNLETWLEAWSLYATVLATAKPRIAPDLFRYQSFITRASCRFQPYAWLQYDSQFRLKLAANPSLCWTATDPELTATWLSADAAKIKQLCYTCGSPDHFAPNCPLKPSASDPGLRCPVCNHVDHTARECSLLVRNGQSSSGSHTNVQHGALDDDKICRAYNKRGFCFRGARCPYSHSCSACHGGHPRRTCPKQVQ